MNPLQHTSQYSVNYIIQTTSYPQMHFLFFFNDPATPEIYPLSYTTLFRSRVRPTAHVRLRSSFRYPITRAPRQHEPATSAQSPPHRPRRSSSNQPAPTPPSGSCLRPMQDRKSTRLNSSHSQISYAVFCLKK